MSAEAVTLALVMSVVGASAGSAGFGTEPPLLHQRASASGCEVSIAAGAGAAAGDANRAREACGLARARFAELFGDPAPAVRVVLWERGGYRVSARPGQATVFWPTSQALTGRVGASPLAGRYIADQWRNVLPHETAHALLAARFFGEARNGARAGYGTPFPDWLDEAVAIWAESRENRDGRIREFRGLPAERRELRAILAMRHPAADNDDILAMRDGAPMPSDEAVWSFYPQSFAVLAFIVEAGGADAVQELASRLLADPGNVEAVAGLPGLPASFDGVLAAWGAWQHRSRHTP